MGSIVWSATSLAGSASGLALIGGPEPALERVRHGRLKNNVRVQDARLQQLIVAYQRRRAPGGTRRPTTQPPASQGAGAPLRHPARRGAAARRSLTLANALYREGYSDFQRVLDAQRALSTQQDAYIVNRGNAVGDLIALYKALGGGWYTEQPLSMRQPASRCSNAPTGAIAERAEPTVPRATLSASKVRSDE